MEIKVSDGVKCLNTIDDVSFYAILRGSMTPMEACDALRRMENFGVTVVCNGHYFSKVEDAGA